MEVKKFNPNSILAKALSPTEFARELFRNTPIETLSAWKKANPVKYEQTRQTAVEIGLLAAPQKLEAPKPIDPAPVDEVAVAIAVQKFSRERCRALFVDSTENASKLAKNEYAEAKLAAQFFGVLPASNAPGVDVKIHYQTPAQRKTKREEREQAEQTEQTKRVNHSAGLSDDGVPPGLQRDPEKPGGFVIADATAFSDWKTRQKELADARTILEKATAQP